MLSYITMVEVVFRLWEESMEEGLGWKQCYLFLLKTGFSSEFIFNCLAFLSVLTRGLRLSGLLKSMEAATTGLLDLRPSAENIIAPPPRAYCKLLRFFAAAGDYSCESPGC